MLLSGLVAMPTNAGEPTREERIKAAIVYKVGKFVDWPESAFAAADAPLRICQLGDDPFAAALFGIAGRVVQGRRVVFQVVVPPLAARTRGCHILYLPRATAARVPRVIRELAGQPVLTISDIPDFARQGGMIALVRAGDRLGFEIAPAMARDAGLRVRAQLLDLADIVDNDHKGLE
ncbi:YfiR family protein [Thiorhodococcus fuscus]|uniref:YfiR family protein n=1 Tax=Thiorhodococcus fuscus TaxID=527200 RepID=A0ABW4YBE5_9GAMM